MTSEPSQPTYGRPWVGICWMLLTGFLFVGVTGIVRYVGSDVPAPQAAFIRYAFGVLFILPFMGSKWTQVLTGGLFCVFAMRGLCHSLGVMLWFYAMARIPIAEVTAIGYLAPIYIAIGAAVFLGEKLAARRIAAIIAAFIGAMVILRPGIQEISNGQMAQVLAAPLFAVSYLVAKRLTAQANPSLVVGMLSIFVTIGIAPFAYVVWITPTLTEVMWLALVGVLATTGHFTMTKALHAAPLAVTQPITFLQLIWATILGLVLFGEAVDFWVLLGGGIIISAVSFISYREWILSRREKTPAALAIKY